MIKDNNHTKDYFTVDHNQHKKFLIEIPKISQKSECFTILYSPKAFNSALLNSINQARNNICLITLYLENDLGGKKIIDAILHTKKKRPNIKIKIIVDWYRAQRSRIGKIQNYTNLHWYNEIIQTYPGAEISIYRIPINISEALGVLHIKGFIIDDIILYSGANINNEYLHIYNKYRYDRYHMIRNHELSQVMLQYINTELLESNVVDKLGCNFTLKRTIANKNKIRLFRKKLRKIQYNYVGNANFNELSITPLVGLGKNNILNQTIYHLISSVKNKIILCTPYFNIPRIFLDNLIYLLKLGKQVEIIVGDKIANDFYSPEQECGLYQFMNTVPYLYEINLRNFLKKTQKFIEDKQLIIRLWKNEKNGYHIKGIWVDNDWFLLTGSNLNPRSLRCDLENALLIHDPFWELHKQVNLELNNIRKYTKLIDHYTNIQEISDYPKKIKKFIIRIRQIKFDRLIYQLL